MSDIYSLQRQPSLLSLPQTDALLGSSKPDGNETLRTPLQRKLASRQLTPLPRPQEGGSVSREESISSASDKSKTGWKSAAPSRKEVGQKLIGQAREKAIEARKMGVDVAKHSFWKKLASVAVAAVGVVIFGALTAVSFGGAAPLAGIAAAALAVSIGDAVCAYRNYKNADAEANHKPPPYPKLPMGNSFLANVGFKLATAVGASEDNAKTFGKGLGVVVGGGLAVTAIALSCGLGSLPMLAAITSKTATGLNGAASGFSALNSAITKDDDREKLDELESGTENLIKRAKDNDPDVRGGRDLYERTEGSAERRKEQVGTLGLIAPLGGPAMDLLLGAK
jgi:hypothetical protein